MEIRVLYNILTPYPSDSNWARAWTTTAGDTALHIQPIANAKIISIPNNQYPNSPITVDSKTKGSAVSRRVPPFYIYIFIYILVFEAFQDLAPIQP